MVKHCIYQSALFCYYDDVMIKGSITKNLIRFAIPLFFGQLLQQLYNVVDSVVVGNVLGKEALAAVSTTGSLIFLMVGFRVEFYSTDDQDGNSAREQAIFDALLETMLDGDRVQTLWTYGAEDVHWSIHAEEFTTNADDPEKKKDYSYEEGEFHLKQSPNDPNSVWKKNHLDSVLVIAPLTNGYVDSDELVQAGNKFFTENCVDAPAAASCNTLTENEAALVEEKTTLMKQAIAGEITPEEAIAQYQADFGDIAQQILDELNAQ